MGCRRCGGVLARELLGRMHGLVCGLISGVVVIGSRTCKCDYVNCPVRVNLLRDGVGAPAGESREITMPVYPRRRDPMISCEKHVLVVDDDWSERRKTALLLEQTGFTVVQACDGLDALSKMQQQDFDAVVTDFHMPHMNGLELLAQSRVIWSDTPVIIVSKAEWDLNEMAMARGAFAWICKSSSPGVLLSMLALAMEQGVTRDFTHEIQVVAA